MASYEWTSPGTKRKERQKRLGLHITPAGADVAAAVSGGHISRSEAFNLNSDYLQHFPSSAKIKPSKPVEKPAKQKAKKPKPSPDKVYKTRTIEKNGKKVKVRVEMVPYDPSVRARYESQERSNPTRSTYRAKEARYKKP